MQVQQFHTLPALEVAADMTLLGDLIKDLDPNTLDELTKERIQMVTLKIVLGSVSHPTLPALSQGEVLNLLLDKYVPVPADAAVALGVLDALQA